MHRKKPKEAYHEHNLFYKLQSFYNRMDYSVLMYVIYNEKFEDLLYTTCNNLPLNIFFNCFQNKPRIILTFLTNRLLKQLIQNKSWTVYNLLFLNMNGKITSNIKIFIFKFKTCQCVVPRLIGVKLPQIMCSQSLKKYNKNKCVAHIISVFLVFLNNLIIIFK